MTAIVENIEKHRNLTALKRAYNDLAQYLKSFDYENDCSGELLNCAYTPPVGTPVFVLMFSKYLKEKQNFKLVTGANNTCKRIPTNSAGTINQDLPYFTSCPINEDTPNFFLISPTGNYAYYITKYMHDNFYPAPENKGTYRARIAIFTDSRHFAPCKLNCTEQEIAKASKLGKNIFKLFITDKEYILPQGYRGCTKSDYYCTPLTTSNCSKDTNNYEACLQKIIEDSWQINY